ncbi:hypothetical protein ANCCAN_30135, partial [Ancylostoma caninum]
LINCSAIALLILLESSSDRSFFSRNRKVKEPTPPSVVGCLFTMFRWEFLTATILKATSDTLQFVNPFLLHNL